MSETYQKGFDEYRATVKRECPVCSDLFHGYRAGHIDQQAKITKLQADFDKAVKFIELLKNKWLIDNLIDGDFCLYETPLGLKLYNELCVITNQFSKQKKIV